MYLLIKLKQKVLTPTAFFCSIEDVFAGVAGSNTRGGSKPKGAVSPRLMLWSVRSNHSCPTSPEVIFILESVDGADTFKLLRTTLSPITSPDGSFAATKSPDRSWLVPSDVHHLLLACWEAQCS